MKKLFKEVWKSFSKSKIILFGLTFLVFLTSGILTLTLDVVNTYRTQFNDYKQVSRLHDLTLNSNIEPTGSKPNIVYKEDKNIPSIWTFEEKNNLQFDSIKIGTDKEFYNLKDLGYSQNAFVSTKDLSYLLTSNIENLEKNDKSNFVFKPNNDQINELMIYTENGKPEYNNISNLENIHKVSGLVSKKWEKTNKVSDFYNSSKKEFESILIDSLNPTNAYIEKFFIERTGINSGNPIYKAYLNNPSRFYRINSDEIAKYFSFVKQEINGDYLFDSELETWIIDTEKPQTLVIDDILNKKIKNSFSINVNDVAGQDTIQIHKTEILSKNLQIPKKWFLYSKEKFKFERNSFTLSGIENNNINSNQWTGIYFDYLKSLSVDDLNFIKTTSYWKKYLINELVYYDENDIETSLKNDEFEIDLVKDDLVRNIKVYNFGFLDLTTTILEIENLKNQIPSNILVKQLNSNNVSNLENKIELESKKLAYKNIFTEIENLVKNVGLRQNITVNSTTNNKTDVFQFINIGNEDGMMNWNGIEFKQEVGKLINPIDNTFINSSEIDKNTDKISIPIDKLPEILDRLLLGLSLDRNYINAMISFQSFEYFDDNKNILNQSNSKIIWLTPNFSTSRSDLIGLSIIKNVDDSDDLTYVFLKEKKINQTDWTEILKFNTLEKMSKHIIENNLNLAPFDYNNNPLKTVSNNGWVKENSNYSNLLSVPFQYLLPSSDIINQLNNERNFEIFKSNLIKKLTQEVKPIISPSNWIILMNAIDSGFSKYGFGEGLIPPASLSNRTIEKIVIGSLRDAAVSTNQSYLNLFFTDIFNGIKKQVLEYAQNDVQKQKEYLKNQIENISFMLKITTGIAFSIDMIDKYLLEPVKLFDSLNLVINSFDWDKIIINLFDDVYNDKRKSNQIVGTGDYIPTIYINLKNESSLKNGLVNLLKSFDLKNIITDFIPPNLLPVSPELIINALNAIKIDRPSVGQTKLIQNTKMTKDYNLDVIYKTIEPEHILNLFSVPILGGLGTILKGIKIEDKPLLPASFDFVYDPNFINPLELDMDLLWFLDKFVFLEDKSKIFNLNLSKIFNEATNSFTQVKDDNNQIVLEKKLSKIALVNDAYLKTNNKEVYYSNNLIKDLDNISEIDDKYKIKVSNVEYVITGTNISVDYMYPVINSENIQVNTKNQAIVYVNKYGFDRIRRSNANSPIDSYFLLSEPKNNLSLTQTQTKLNQLVYCKMTGGYISDANANLNSNIYKKAYLFDETSLLNPERTLRITAIDSLIEILVNVQKYVGILLFTITGIMVAFVVRRYINSRIKVIGILRAQGYSSFKIALSICLLSFIISIFGGLFGYLAGHFSQFGIFNLLSLFWTIPISIVPFNWITLVLNFFVPFILLAVLIILLTLWFLRKNPINLLNDSLEISDTRISRKIKELVQKTSIKNKFSVSLALNSIGKLIALFVSVSITATIALFSISTYQVFKNSLEKTHKNRNFAYKTDFITPTIESGNYAEVRINQDLNNEKVTSFDNSSFLIDNMLYVPIGIAEEGYTYLSDYFKPGFNPILNKKIDMGNGELENSNGNIDENDTTTPHIFTKSSIDLTVKAGGLSINVWSNLYNAIPESQRVSIIDTSQESAQWLKWTQEGQEYIYKNKKYVTKFVNFDQSDEYMTLYDLDTKTNLKIIDKSDNESKDIRIPYFNYIKNDEFPEKSHFEYRSRPEDQNWSNDIKYFDSILVINGNEKNNLIRQEYRNFLVNGYKKMFSFGKNKELSILPFSRSKMPKFTIDYFIMPGAIGIGNDLNGNIDETYTYINADIFNYKDQLSKKIYGYDQNSKYIKITDSEGNNLLNKAYSFNENNIYPLIVNEVVKHKYKVNVNDEIEFKINNSYLKNQQLLDNAIKLSENKISNINDQSIIKFKVIGINDTYINEEWITTKKHANEILNLDNNGYNGVFTNSDHPIQLLNSLSLYSTTGYWAPQESIENIDHNNLSQSKKEENLNIYKQFFYQIDNNSGENTSLLARNIKLLYQNKYPDIKITNKQINEKIKNILSIDDLNIIDAEKDSATILNSINEFINIYGNKVLQSSFVNTVSNGIEKEFVLNASSAVNDGMIIILSISFVISLTILVIVTTMLINENERNIAIFGILGYRTREKIRMLFSIYVPIVIISLLLSILLTWFVIPVFAYAVLTASSIALTINISFINILISSLIVIGVFSITCIISWIIQGRIKSIVLLKGV